jgi:hypothetical protein
MLEPLLAVGTRSSPDKYRSIAMDTDTDSGCGSDDIEGCFLMLGCGSVSTVSKTQAKLLLSGPQV